MKLVKTLGVLALGIGAVAAVAVAACDGFSCQNACPLAQTANKHRSFGIEGSAARTALGIQVQKNLARI